MLTELRAKPDAASVQLVQATMQAFELFERRFELIFSAFRAFQHLDEVADQLACLARVRAHLAPRGIFAFDVFNPRLERLATSIEAEVADLEFEHQGRRVRRFAQNVRDPARQVTTLKTRYVEYEADHAVREVQATLTMRWFYRFELEHLLHRAGFRKVEIFGDFDGSPVTAESPALVVVAA
jgi:trans-aconitate methyltransferase